MGKVDRTIKFAFVSFFQIVLTNVQILYLRAWFIAHAWKSHDKPSVGRLNKDLRVIEIFLLKFFVSYS